MCNATALFIGFGVEQRLPIGRRESLPANGAHGLLYTHEPRVFEAHHLAHLKHLLSIPENGSAHAMLLGSALERS